MLLYTRLAPPKVPKRRSRAGCNNCKEKKKKCDEERPQCARCAERGVECVYEAVRPRQRRKRDPTASAAATSSHLRRPHPLSRDAAQATHDSRGANYPGWTDDEFEHVLLNDLRDLAVKSPLDSTFDTASLLNVSPINISTPSEIEPSVHEFPPVLDEDEAASSTAGDYHAESGGAAIVPHSRSLYPDLAMIAPYQAGSPLLEFCSPAFSEFSDRPNRRALVDHFCNVLSHLIVFREESGNPFQQLVLPLTQKSSPVTNAIYALASAHLEYRGVENTEKSLYFHNRAIQGLAGLIQQGNKVNRNEVLAAIMLLVYYEVLVQRGRSNIVDGHLKGALTVMCTNSEPSDPTSDFLERAFRFYDVIAALSNGSAPLSAAPAAGCLLPFPPLGAPAGSPLSNVDTLLGMATTLWPVLHRLSNLLPLKSELRLAVRTNAMSSKIAVLRTELESTAEAIEAALTQWQPILPPNFVPDEDEIKDPTFTVRATEIRETQDQAADGTCPAAPSSPTFADRARIHSILHNALAYRHSAFVYLYRTIFTYPRAHRLVQMHAHLSLTHCVATVAHAGPMGALLWPLFVAACEAVSIEDRELADRAFEAVKKRQGMMNIERAWEIVQEVWRRADLAEIIECLQPDRSNNTVDGAAVGTTGCSQDRTLGSMSPAVVCDGDDDRTADLWRQVSKDMGVNIVFG